MGAQSPDLLDLDQFCQSCHRSKWQIGLTNPRAKQALPVSRRPAVFGLQTSQGKPGEEDPAGMAQT